MQDNTNLEATRDQSLKDLNQTKSKSQSREDKPLSNSNNNNSKSSKEEKRNDEDGLNDPNNNNLENIDINSSEKKEISEPTETQPLLGESNEVDLKSISTFRRWYLRENPIWYFLEKFIVRNQFSRFKPRERKNLTCARKYLAPNLIPITDKSTLYKLKALHTLKQGIGDYAEYIWPLMLYSMIGYDVFRYFISPTRQYQTTALNLFSGAYRNEWAVSSGIDDGFPNSFSFLVLPIVLSVSLILLILLNVGRSIYTHINIYIDEERGKRGQVFICH